MAENDFEFSGDARKLTVRVDLDQYVVERFDEACRKLSNADGEAVSIDLSGINYICSTCLGQLVVTKDRCTEVEKDFSLKINRKLMDIFDLLSIRDLIQTEVVD